MLNIGTVVGGGFRLIREHPLAIAVWAALYLAITVGMIFAMRPFTALWASAATADPQAMVVHLLPMMRWLFLIEIVMLALFVMLIAAPLRAVLRPSEPGFFYLRVGMDELRLFGLMILLIILGYAAMIVSFIPIALVAAGAAIAAGPVGAIVIMMVSMIAWLGVLIWLEVRLSLVFPLTLLRRKIIIGESWRLTRGNFWTLFGAYVVVFVIVAVAWIVLMSLAYGPYFAEIMRAGTDPRAVQAAQLEMVQRMGTVTPATILTSIATALVGVLTLAFGGGAVATAALELSGPSNDIAETFA